MSTRSPTVLLVLSLLLSACQCGRTPPAMATLKQEGEECQRDEECATGLCEGAPATQPVCRRKCADGCRTGEVCTQLTPLRYACVPDRGGLCQACQIDSDCPYPSDKCIVVNGEGVCGRDCAFDQTCPTSYRCLNGVGTDGRPKAQQCSPSSGSCECTAATAGQMVSCMNQNGFGTCSGTRTCDGLMGYSACTAETPAAETCNGKDDDCDGRADEELPTVTCGLGVCQRTVPSCADGGTFVCTPGDAGVEVCNGLDDDCDGTPDNGISLQTDVTNCGRCGTVCMVTNATPRCVAGQCDIGQCTMPFDDCNGRLTDGCEVNTSNDVNHCGMCGRRCTAAGATGTCTNGQCGFTCNPGFVDLDQDPANGCEYQCTVSSLVDLPDVGFIDANCDGMDGEVTNGIFVSLVGDDTNPGTRDDPVFSIAEGVRKAVQQGKRDVYVAGGTYQGPLVLAGLQGRIIAGGYLPSTNRWLRTSSTSSAIIGGNPALVIADAGAAQADAGVTVQFFTVRGDNATGQDALGRGQSAYGARVQNSQQVRLELLNVTAGNGAPGSTGGPGTPGDDGNRGGDGVAGLMNDSSVIPFLCGQTNPRPAASTGGTSSCGRSGGSGGRPGYYGSDSPGSTASGPGGSGVIGTMGGLGGASEAALNVAANMVGTAGNSGGAGSNGNAATQLGTFSVTGLYTPSSGGLGLTGQHGNGGGGGGGGGGGCQYERVFGVDLCRCWTWGSVGGAGGGGGCGGTGGQPGRSGGGSFGLVVTNSQVIARQTTVRSGNGGNGGNGGTGAAGGTGGAGGTSNFAPNAQYTAGRGGPGGRGGDGGPGGHGGAGSGGPSISLLRDSGSTVNVMTGFTLNLGTPGTGGTSSGNGGQTGFLTQDYQY
ncbi:MAG: hypothetical protein SFW67_23545 [Myxococcaceae bacterium]|nr:hypothetical protein [Myxococcaceae bacterium]